MLTSGEECERTAGNALLDSRDAEVRLLQKSSGQNAARWQLWGTTQETGQDEAAAYEAIEREKRPTH